ncbi:MAG: hypothetical protein LHV68_09835 [Elusimicrobia bacterium]|nr:hypothetical protein [Candidatus Liberimonas magnetica]
MQNDEEKYNESIENILCNKELETLRVKFILVLSGLTKIKENNTRRANISLIETILDKLYDILVAKSNS